MSGDDQEPAAGGEQRGRGRSRVGPPHGHQAPKSRATQVRGPALLAFRARWEALDPKRQLRLKQAAVALGIAALGGGIYAASSGADPDEAPQAPAASLDMGAGLRGDSLEFKMRGDLQKILEGQTLLNDRVTAIQLKTSSLNDRPRKSQYSSARHHQTFAYKGAHAQCRNPEGWLSSPTASSE